MKRLLAIIFTFFALNLSAQTIESLQKSNERSRKEIENANKMISSNKNKEKQSRDQLALANSKIKNRNDIINNLHKQQEILSKDIKENEKRILELNSELVDLKKEYAAIMRFSYKNHLHNNMLYYLFSSTSLEDLHRRMYYLRRYSKLRTDKAEQIKETSNEITRQVASLQTKQNKAKKLEKETAAEVATLGKERDSYNATIKTLNQQNKNLSSTIAAEKKKIKNNEALIKKIMAEEARKLAAAKKQGTTAQSAEIVRLSNIFAENKGKLPAPVRNGTVTEHWGIHPHPVYEKIQVNNLGVDYTIPNGEPIRAVFDGVVSTIHVSAGLNNSIIIRHGEYFTVYTGLNIVNVKKGDEVKTGQAIGTIRTDQNVNTFNFAVWQNSTNLNPELWIRR